MAKGTGGPSGDECQNLVAQAYRWQNQKDGLVADDVVGLRASTGSSGFHEMNHPVVAQAFRKSKRAQSATDDETWVDDGLANTLNGFDTGDARTTHAVAFTQNQRDEVRELGDRAASLSGQGTHQTNYVAFTIDMQACKGNANVGDGSVSPTLCKPSGNDCHAVAIPLQDGRDIAKAQNGLGIGSDGDPSYTLDRTGAQSIAIGMDAEFNARMEQMGTLKRGGEGGRDECVAIGVDVYNGIETGDVAATVTSATGIANASGPKAIAFNWQNGGGYGNANDGLGITEEGTGPLQRCQTPAVAFKTGNSAKARSDGMSEEQSPTLGSNTGGNTVPAVAFSCEDHGADASAVAPTLRAMPHSGSHANGDGQVAVAFAQNQVGEIRTSETMSTIGTTGNASARTTPKVMVSAESQGSRIRSDDEPSETLRATKRGPYSDFYQSGMVVRRLTPVECERLQGFPDGWTDVGTPEKPTADSHRYKQLGNAVTVNVAEWLARRIRRCLEQ